MSHRIKKLGRELADQYEKGYSVGRKAGLAEARTKIEGLRANAPAWPDDDSYEAGLDAALASLDEGGTSE